MNVRGRSVGGFEGRRVQELLAYLIVNRGRPIAREVIVEALWPGRRSEPRKQLRHTLWQLQTALETAGSCKLIESTPDWIGLCPDGAIRADVIRLEAAHNLTRGVRDDELTGGVMENLRTAVAVYRGDLLERCYEDWCLLERVRYRAIYLSILDKLMAHAEASGGLEDGIAFGELVLRYDRASERTHRRIMRLRYRSGDRTGALRQYDACADALRQELDVDPAQATLALRDLMREGAPPPWRGVVGARSTDSGGAALQDLLTLEQTLAKARTLVASVVAAIRADSHSGSD